MDNDPCKFVLSCRGSSERFTLQAANTDIKQVWVQHITELLDAQSNFLSGEDALAYQLLCFNSLTLQVHLLGMVWKVWCVAGTFEKALSNHYLWVMVLYLQLLLLSPHLLECCLIYCPQLFSLLLSIRRKKAALTRSHGTQQAADPAPPCPSAQKNLLFQDAAPLQ